MVVAALLAFNVAVLYALPPRQLIFTLAVTIGAVLLISVNWQWLRNRKRASARPQLGSGEHPLLAAENKKGESQKPVIPVASSQLSTPAQPSEKLTPAQAREWLDDFLVKQQQK